MKHFVTCTACALLAAALLTACGGKQAASASTDSAPASMPAASSAAASKPADSAPAASATSGSASGEAPSSEATPATETKTVNVTVQIDNEPDTTAVLVLQIPGDWDFNGYSVFTRDEAKIAEFATAWKVTDPQNPFPAERTDPFARPETVDGPQYPEGYGLQETLDRSIDGKLARTYLYKSMPSDVNTVWYPHYTLFRLDDYVLQMHFYSFDKTADDAVFDAVLASAKLVLS